MENAAACSRGGRIAELVHPRREAVGVLGELRADLPIFVLRMRTSFRMLSGNEPNEKNLDFGCVAWIGVGGGFGAGSETEDEIRS